MFSKIRRFQFVISVLLIAVFWLTPLAASGQDLVSYSSIASGSSVFVFRNAQRSVRRVVAAKPVRSQAARLQTVTRIKKQYETIARINPKPGREKIVTPDNVPRIKSLPPTQGSKVLAGVGEYYIQQNDFENAMDVLREAMTLDPKNTAAKLGYSEAVALKGNDKLEKNLPKEAQALFTEALANNPKNSAAYFGLGEVYSQLDQTSEAIASYERSLENDPKLTEIYVPLGILYFQTGEIAKADAILAKALAASPERAETQYFFGLVRAKEGRNEEALQAFQRARAIDPNYAEAFYRAGEALDALDRSGEAVPEYQNAVALKKDYFDAWLGLGGAQYAAGNYAASAEAFTTAKRIKNDNWQTVAGLGDANLKLGKFNDAEGNFKLAATMLMREPNFNKDTAADLYSKAGFAIGMQCPINQAKFIPCQWPSAIKSLEKAVELGGKPIDYTNLGWAYFNASRVDRGNRMAAEQQAKLQLAKAALQKAIDANPPFIDNALQNFGVVQNDLGDFRGAIETFNKVIVKSDSSFTRYALGAAYFMVAENDNAAASFRAAVDLDPDNIDALSALGSLEVKRKNLKEANKILEQLKQKKADSAAAKLEQEIKLSGFKLK